jgi:recombination protein U
MKNEGKKFEEDVIKSVPSEWFYQRLKDAAGWSNGENTRFTISNPFDFIIFDGKMLFCLELKSCLGKSLPISNIKPNQITGLISAHEKIGVRAGLLINFRDVEETYFLDAFELNLFIKSGARKSIPIDHCRELGVLVTQKKKIKRYSYDIKEFVKEVE